MAKAAYPTIGIAAFVMFGIVYFIGCLPLFSPMNTGKAYTDLGYQPSAVSSHFSPVKGYCEQLFIIN